MGLRGLRSPALLVLGALACSSGTDVVTQEPEPATMEVRIDGNLALTVNKSGGTTGPGIRLSLGTPSTLDATFRNAAGSIVANNSSDFQLDVTPANAAILQFTRTGLLRGQLTGSSAGSTTVRLSLRHISQGHDDFPASFLPVLIQ